MLVKIKLFKLAYVQYFISNYHFKLMKQENLKKKLLDFCLKQQYERLETAQKAVEDAAETAMQEDTSVEEKTESFRTQMQAERDMFIKQLSEAREGLHTLHKIELDRPLDTAVLGAVVITNTQKLFFATNIGQIKIENDTFFAISLEAPLAKAVMGKRVGESFTFRDKTSQVLEVF